MKSFRTFITEQLDSSHLYPLASSSLNVKSLARFNEALNILNDALNTKIIANTKYNDIKNIFNSVLENSFSVNWSEKYSHGKGNDVSDIVDDIRWLSPGLHTLESSIKKIQGKVDPAVAPAVAVLSEFKQISIDMKTLKGYIKSAKEIRDMTPKVTYTNPNQVRGTCAWCLRDIALDKSGKMAHHGFQRPGHGYQTNSCPGISYKNAEVSLDGLKARIAFTVNSKQISVKELERLPTLISLPVRSRLDRNKIEQIGKEDPRWVGSYKVMQHSIEYTIRQHDSDIEYLNKELLKWEEKHKNNP